jgi:hypothetical protein
MVPAENKFLYKHLLYITGIQFRRNIYRLSNMAIERVTDVYSVKDNFQNKFMTNTAQSKSTIHPDTVQS